MKKKIIGIAMMAASIIPLFFTKDLGITTVLSAFGWYVMYSEDEWIVNLFNNGGVNYDEV